MGELADRMRAMLEPETTATEAGARGFASKLLNNSFQMPNYIAGIVNRPSVQKLGDVLGQTAGAIRTGDFTQFRSPQAPMEAFNAQPFQNLPTADDVYALAQRGGEAAAALTNGGGQFTPMDTALNQQQNLSRQMQSEHPIASASGSALGTAAMLTGGRAPSITAARNMRLAPNGKIPNARALVPYQAPGIKRLFTDILRSKPIQNLGGFAARVGETGLEGAAVGVMESGDPVEMALWGAGSQAAGSTLLSVMPTTAKGALGFVGTVAGLTVLARFGQEFSPGENNFWDALDVPFNKAKYLLIGGILSGMSGMGRVNSRSIQDNLPVFAEALSQIPRGMYLSFINDYTKDDTVKTVMDQISVQPDYFGATAQRRIERTLNNGGSLADEMQSLMEDSREFREAFNQLD